MGSGLWALGSGLWALGKECAANPFGNNHCIRYDRRASLNESFLARAQSPEPRALVYENALSVARVTLTLRHLHSWPIQRTHVRRAVAPHAETRTHRRRFALGAGHSRAHARGVRVDGRFVGIGRARAR